MARHISAADLGTNTVKITHATVTSAGEINAVNEAAKTIRLGKSIEENGSIAPERIDACIDFLRQQQSLGTSIGSTEFVGVATETFRIASNSTELLNRIVSETAWRIRVIAGDEEARLTYAGLRDRIPTASTTLIVDIGGGSTELICVENDTVISSISIPLGSGRLADHFFHEDPPGSIALDTSIGRAAEAFNAVTELPTSVDAIMLAGGNGVFIDELVEQLFPDAVLSPGTVTRLITHFAETPAMDAARRIGIAHERAKVLPAGAAIASALLTCVSTSQVKAAPSGIRLGLIRQTADS